MSEKITSTTLVEELKESDVSKDETNNQTLYETINDLSVNLNSRLKAFQEFFSTKGEQEALELVSKLGMMYQFSGIKTLREYLCSICTKTTISPVLKSSLIQSLIYYNEKDDIGYETMIEIWSELNTINVPIPCQVELVVLLMKNSKYEQQAIKFFCSIINNNEIESEYRYKTILGLEKANVAPLFSVKACLSFISNTKNPTRFRILAGQNLLRRKECLVKGDVESLLLSFSKDNDLDVNIRADATDVLLQYGSDAVKEEAKEIIQLLGRSNKGHTIFDNSQNVHTISVEESVNKIIESLNNDSVLKIEPFEKVEKAILEIVEKEKIANNIPKDEKYPREEYIKTALNRIYMDRALYSTYSCSLMHILCKVWSYITHSSEQIQQELTERLLEELVEMSGTCSTGYVSRLVNSITGFGDFNIRISWRDQIVANLAGRLNAKIREIDNLDLQEKVLNELMLNTNDYQNRTNFLFFFRSVMLSIRDEMYLEFREHMTDTDYDLYFRSAISNYESGGYV